MSRWQPPRGGGYAGLPHTEGAAPAYRVPPKTPASASPTPEQLALARTITDLNTELIAAYVQVTAPLVDALNRDLANFAEAMRRAQNQ